MYCILVHDACDPTRGGSCREHGLLMFAVVPVSVWIAYKYYVQRSLTLPEQCEGLIYIDSGAYEPPKAARRVQLAGLGYISP